MRIATVIGRSRHGYCRDGLVNATEAGKGRDRTCESGTGNATAYLSPSWSRRGIIGVRVQPAHRPCENPWTEESYRGLERGFTSPA
ncbi:hypothetical protein Taro_044586 [Colocasia esculenta]|uniref:Uncharacterized protein n=1 Tax=Colocasia esculenta TaxID=4460 RepID=A0A843WYL6_COLES|nr:hypothetical protein [Colocasia esculenta]